MKNKMPKDLSDAFLDAYVELAEHITLYRTRRRLHYYPGSFLIILPVRNRNDTACLSELWTTQCAHSRFTPEKAQAKKGRQITQLIKQLNDYLIIHSI